MPHRNLSLNLRQRAHEILKQQVGTSKTVPYDQIYEHINELDIKRIELDLVNEQFENVSLELDELQNKYNQLYQFIPFGFFNLNAKGIVSELNDAAAHAFGFNKSQLLNRTLLRYIAPNFHHIFIEHCQLVLESDKAEVCELKLIRKNGPMFHARFKSISCKDTMSGEISIMSFFTELSEHKHKEDYFLQQTKLTTKRETPIAELTAVISQELNLPLSVINNFLHGCIIRLERNDSNTSALINALKSAIEQSHRISDILLRMKNFSCNGLLQIGAFSADEMIKEAIALLYYEHDHEELDIQYHTTKHLPLVHVDKIHIQHVLINLSRNAIEAMRDAGVAHPRLKIETNQLTTDLLEICVIDNGPGIDSNHVHKLFNPYFTTKVYGVGLGLAVSRSIVKAHKGEIYFEENPFGGSCFKFTLPLYHPPIPENHFKLKRNKKGQ